MSVCFLNSLSNSVGFDQPQTKVDIGKFGHLK